jgi:hypothetical protein
MPQPIVNCKNCTKEFSKHYGSTGVFCGHTCQGLFRKKETRERFKLGLISNRKRLKEILLEIKDSCWECDLKEWQGVLLPLEVDHIDGNVGHDMPDNVRLLCPNCHSITPTWKAKNKGNGRASRGLKLN